MRYLKKVIKLPLRYLKKKKIKLLLRYIRNNCVTVIFNLRYVIPTKTEKHEEQKKLQRVVLHRTV